MPYKRDVDPRGRRKGRSLLFSGPLPRLRWGQWMRVRCRLMRVRRAVNATKVVSPRVSVGSNPQRRLCRVKGFRDILYNRQRHRGHIGQFPDSWREWLFIGGKRWSAKPDGRFAQTCAINGDGFPARLRLVFSGRISTGHRNWIYILFIDGFNC